MSNRFEHYLWIESTDPKHAPGDDCTHQWARFNFGQKCSSCEGWRYEVQRDTETGDFTCTDPSWRFQHLPTNERTCKHTQPLIENATRAAELHHEEAHSQRRVTEAELVDVLAHVESHRH